MTGRGQTERKREKVARTGLLARALLLAIKVVAAIFTGSISIVADAVHGLVDLSGAVIGYIGVRVANKPPDEEHHFGHSRAEDIAGASIATLIFLAAVIVAYEAVGRLMDDEVVQMVEAGIAATAVVVAIKLLASRYLLANAYELDSLAIEAMGKDLQADVLSSGAVLVGLALVRFTGEPVVDPIVAIIVVGLILQSAYSTMRKAISNLMDRRLPPEEETAIRNVLDSRDDIQDYHALRTRKAGDQRYVQMHIVVGRDRTVEDAHNVAEELERAIREALPGTAVTIHIEPCSPPCEECAAQCDSPPDRSEPR
ncbi:MAG: cation diffusion facilitator family transporter [Chloroflexota bacterium]